jgi:hypothetical protein
LSFSGENLQLTALAQPAYQLQVHLVPAACIDAIHLHDLQARHQTGPFRNAVRLNRPEDRCDGGDTKYGDEPEGDYGEQKVGGRAGSDDGDTFFDVLAIECPIEVLCRNFAFALIEHLDGDKLGQTEVEKLELEFRQKAREFQTESRQLNEAKAAADREMLEALKPKLDQAVEAVLKGGDYDLVIDRSAVVDVKAQFDITRQVIERLNSMR